MLFQAPAKRQRAGEVIGGSLQGHSSSEDTRPRRAVEAEHLPSHPDASLAAPHNKRPSAWQGGADTAAAAGTMTLDSF